MRDYYVLRARNRADAWKKYCKAYVYRDLHAVRDALEENLNALGIFWGPPQKVGAA